MSAQSAVSPEAIIVTQGPSVHVKPGPGTFVERRWYVANVNSAAIVKILGFSQAFKERFRLDRQVPIQEVSFLQYSLKNTACACCRVVAVLPRAEESIDLGQMFALVIQNEMGKISVLTKDDFVSHDCKGKERKGTRSNYFLINQLWIVSWLWMGIGWYLDVHYVEDYIPFLRGCKVFVPVEGTVKI